MKLTVQKLFEKDIHLIRDKKVASQVAKLYTQWKPA